jgi:hypothetical protein
MKMPTMKKLPLLLAAFTMLLSSCKKESEEVYKITYSIGCTDCMVAYVADQAGNQSSAFHQNSSWSYSFNAKKNQEVLLMAYNTSSAPQGVTATIMLNDELLETRTTYCAISGVSFCADTVR